MFSLSTAIHAERISHSSPPLSTLSFTLGADDQLLSNGPSSVLITVLPDALDVVVQKTMNSRIVRKKKIRKGSFIWMIGFMCGVPSKNVAQNILYPFCDFRLALK
jgi:hypothetical protein